MNSLKTGTGTILSFGELLLRICPDPAGQWLNDNSLPFYVGGAELNVATALALWGLPSKYLTALPDNGLSQQILSYLKNKNIDVSPVLSFGERMGLYFLTSGQDLKHNALVYDRANSSFSQLKPGMINWDEVLRGVTWLHFSAICPAISQGVADVCLEMLQAATEKGVTISVDLNYRAKLWQYDKQPMDIMPQLLPYCDLVMGNVWAAETMLGIPVTPDIHESGLKSLYQKAALYTSEEIIKQYPKCKAVANTFRFDSRDTINYYTTLYTGDDFITSAEYTATEIVDKVGSGDCFMAGLIYGFYRQWDAKEIVNYAAAAAFKKLFVKGDATNLTVEDIKTTMNNE
jgi:2-dehydro-3-deoxygluconokinase